MPDNMENENTAEEEQSIPPFCIRDGKTFIKRRKGMMAIFGDFTLKIIGETETSNAGYWVLSCGARVRGVIEERRIVIPVSAFDSKSKFLERTRSAFGGGSFNLNDVSSSDLDSYHTYLKDKYYGEGPIKEYKPVELIGFQAEHYWCFSKEVHIYNERLLSPEDHKYVFVDQDLQPFEVHVEKLLLEGSSSRLLSVCKRFILSSEDFGVNAMSFKLATAFVIARLLRVDDKESWNESSIGMLHSSYEERNVGKSLSLDLLAKGVGVHSRGHNMLLAGGDQNQSGTSVTEGRVIVLEYTKGEGLFSSEDEQKLRDGVKTIAAENTGFLLAWAVKYKPVWDRHSKDGCDVIYAILSKLRPELQPRWHKGMAAVLFAFALFHSSVDVRPNLAGAIIEVARQNEPPTPQDDDLLTRLERSLLCKITNDSESNVLRWLNPIVKVSVSGKFSEAVGVRSSALEQFSQVSMKEIAEKVRQETDMKSSIAMVFANSDNCTLENIQKRKNEVKMAKGWKLPTHLFSLTTLNAIRERCGMAPKEVEECSSAEESDREMEDACGRQVTGEELHVIEQLEEKLKEACKDGQSMERGEEEKEAEDSLKASLSPSTTNFWRELTPRRKRAFEKGFAAGMKKERKGNEELDTETTEEANQEPELDTETMEEANQEPELDTETMEEVNQESMASTGNSGEMGARKRLFPSGTIGAIARAGSGESETNTEDICSGCGKESPQKKAWSRRWIRCDQCSHWYHKECTKLKRMPRRTESWVCDPCLADYMINSTPSS